MTKNQIALLIRLKNKVKELDQKNELLQSKCDYFISENYEELEELVSMCSSIDSSIQSLVETFRAFYILFEKGRENHGN